MRFESYLVENPEDRFSREVAHFIPICCLGWDMGLSLVIDSLLWESKPKIKGNEEEKKAIYLRGKRAHVPLETTNVSTLHLTLNALRTGNDS